MKVKHDPYEKTINLEELTLRDVGLVIAALENAKDMGVGISGDASKLAQEIETKLYKLSRR